MIKLTKNSKILKINEIIKLQKTEQSLELRGVEEELKKKREKMSQDKPKTSYDNLSSKQELSYHNLRTQ